MNMKDLTILVFVCLFGGFVIGCYVGTTMANWGWERVLVEKGVLIEVNGTLKFNEKKGDR
jgi:hypothetical protein